MQVIPRDGSNPSMTFGYTVQYPYAITRWTQTLSVVPVGSTLTASFASATPPICALGQYAATGQNTGGTCYKSGITVNFAKGASDYKFSGQVCLRNMHMHKGQ